MNFFAVKGQKWKKPLKISKNCFLSTDLRFSLPFQNFMSHIEFMKFCQNHWSLTCTPTYPLCGNPDYTVELGNTERGGGGGGG
jgi:hypothetical protein